MSGPGSILAEKAGLRAKAADRRQGLPAQERARFSGQIAQRVIEYVAANPTNSISLYVAIRTEVDPGGIMAWAFDRGIQVALPAIVKDRGLVFRGYGPGEALVDGGFGTRVPMDAAKLVAPELIIAPLLAFDRAGHRLGYGRGYYDRAIARYRDGGRRLQLLGIAFSVQELERVPAEDHDQLLDTVVSEREVINCTGLRS